MNVPAADGSRRRFLTRLFAEPHSNISNSELSALPELRRHTDGVLWAMAGTTRDNLYVAGDDGFVCHFNGAQWLPEEFPGRLPIHSLCLLGESVYSVGWLGLICEREGGVWRRIQGGGKGAGTENLPLFDIEADENGHLWAVGDQGRIVSFDGSRWQEHDSGTSANLRAVLPLADGRVLASGTGGTVVCYEEGRWLTLVTDTGCPITSMARLGDGSVIAVGGEYDIDSGRFRGRIFLYSRGQWQGIESEHPLPRLRRVRSAGDKLLLCGDDGTAFRWSEDGAKRLPGRLRYDLHDIVTLNDDHLLICGDGGTVLKEVAATAGAATVDDRQQKHWRAISQGETNRTLRCLCPIGGDSLIAAGDSGTVLHIEADRVRHVKTPQQLRIHDLWSSSAKNVFAVCDNATILHFDGDDWRIAHQGGVDTALLAITGFGPHDIFAVGDNGYALRYDGLMWRQIETGIQQELYGLWGQDSQHLLAVGGGGIILRWNGERWKSFGAGTQQDLYSVCGSGLEKLFITGLAGTLIRFEDNAWHRDFSGVRSDLHDVTGSDGIYYAVGSNGTILRNTGGIWEVEHSDEDNTLQAVATSANSVYAIGSGGLVLKRS